MTKTKKEDPKESEESRREFITKLVTTAGAIAAAGLIAGAASEPVEAKVYAVTLDKSGAAQYRLGKHKNGFSIVLSGLQLGNALCQSGLLGENADPNTAHITIEFSY